MDLLITIPLPPQELHSNARVSWKACLDPKKSARGSAIIETLNAMDAAKIYKPKYKWHEIESLEIHFFFKENRRRDKTNLLAWLKSSIDGIVTAGLLDDDKDLWPQWLESHKDPKERVEFRFKIWEKKNEESDTVPTKGGKNFD